MGLDVAMEQPGTGGVGLVSEDHPGAGSFSRDAGEAVQERRVLEIEGEAGSLGSGDGGEVEGAGASANGEELVGVLVDGMGLSDRALDLDDQVDPLVELGPQDQIARGDLAGVLEQ